MSVGTRKTGIPSFQPLQPLQPEKVHYTFYTAGEPLTPMYEPLLPPAAPSSFIEEHRWKIVKQFDIAQQIFEEKYHASTVENEKVL